MQSFFVNIRVKMLVLVVLGLISNVLAKDANPVVKTPMGEMEGSTMQTLLGRPIYAFRGIRYAEPPVNDLRFQPPVPTGAWEGTYNATADGFICPQPFVTPISEDCLFLNVYTTKLPEVKNNPKRPVIFYMHPGGFYAVTGISTWAGPEYFLDQDIVLVTINYRLASLGFLSTGDKHAPGNNGLKDQVVALKWVKKNIEAFGGDSNLITLLGYSAGGMSVNMHLMSPMSRDLFQRGVIMSASVLGQIPIPNHQFNLAQKQAQLVGCPDDTSANIIKCLKTKPAMEIAENFQYFQEFAHNPTLIWSPVVEPDCGQERFLTELPLKMAKRGDFSKIPIMAGISALEFVGLAYEVVGNSTLLREMDEDWERVAPISFQYERNTDNSKKASKELRKFYLGEGPLDENSLEGLKQLYAEGLTGFAINRAAKMLAEKNSHNVYYYRFNYARRYSHFYLPGTTTPLGAVHHDDLIYMFNSFIFPKFAVSDPEYKIVKKWTTLIANFARTGKPIPEPSAELDDVEWLPFDNQTKKYMDIAEKLVLRANLYEERYQLWEKLFPVP